MNEEYFEILMERYINGKFSGNDLVEIRSLLNDPEYRERLDVFMKENMVAAETFYPVPDENMIARIEQFVQTKIKRTPVQLYGKRWLQYAAVILLALGTGTYFWLNKADAPAIIAGNTGRTVNDVAPGKQGARLTLADGSIIVLENEKDGSIATQNGTRVVLSNGQLIYNASHAAAAVGYNTISTPKGRQFQILLPDGTKVWLNAASTLKYPTAFTGSERKVEITGEAYFEIMPNGHAPFIVQTDQGAEVQVLGTSFNIMAYPDEKQVITTLIDGSVKVVRDEKYVLLKPGEQALLNTEALLSVDSDNVDTEEAVAWKNGFFVFDNTDLDVIMRRISRWYDVEVSYSSSPEGRHYTGSVRSNSNVSDVLRKLELAGRVAFEVQGKKIMVKLK